MSSVRTKSTRPGRREIQHAPTERALPSAPRIPVPVIPRERSPGFRAPSPGATESLDAPRKKPTPPKR